MADRRVTMRLNQQQTELLDKTVVRGEAADRTALIRRALREYAEAHLKGGAAPKPGKPS